MPGAEAGIITGAAGGDRASDSSGSRLVRATATALHQSRPRRDLRVSPAGLPSAYPTPSRSDEPWQIDGRRHSVRLPQAFERIEGGKARLHVEAMPHDHAEARKLRHPGYSACSASGHFRAQGTPARSSLGEALAHHGPVSRLGTRDTAGRHNSYMHATAATCMRSQHDVETRDRLAPDTFALTPRQT